MSNRFMTVWLPLFLVMAAVAGIVAFFSIRPQTQVACGQMAFEDSEDEKANDGQPRQLCLSLPEGMKLKKAPADKPPLEVSSFELLRADGSLAGAVVSCEKEAPACMQVIAVYALAWQTGDCIALPDDLGIACRTAKPDSKGNYLAGGYVDFGASLDEPHPDVDVILLSVGPDPKQMDAVRDALLSTTIR